MDSKGGSWQQSGGLLQPPWLFRRKASPGPPLRKTALIWVIPSWVWSRHYGGLAQLGERLPCKQEVTGSIPVLSTREKELTEVTQKSGFIEFLETLNAP